MLTLASKSNNISRKRRAKITFHLETLLWLIVLWMLDQHCSNGYIDRCHYAWTVDNGHNTFHRKIDDFLKNCEWQFIIINRRITKFQQLISIGIFTKLVAQWMKEKERNCLNANRVRAGIWNFRNRILFNSVLEPVES